MSTQALRGEDVHSEPATVRPYLLGGLAALSVGAATIHFAVVFEHFAEYALYGVFFLVISWAQMIWPAVVAAITAAGTATTAAARAMAPLRPTGRSARDGRHSRAAQPTISPNSRTQPTTSSAPTDSA